MKESRETYYDILGLSQKATQLEIKKAYLDLCKNYHPDKLPFDMPDGAKKYIKERMILINESYEVLKDESTRKKYDEQLISFYSPQQNFQHQKREHENKQDSDKDISELFNELILNQAAKQLENEDEQVNNDFQAEIKRIERKYERHLKTIKKHTPGNTDVMDSSLKLEKVIIFVICIFIILWFIPLDGIYSFFGKISLIVLIIRGINVVLSPTYKSSYVKEIKNAKENRDKQNKEIRVCRENKLQQFRATPIDLINYDFVLKLSAVDRLFLLKVIQEHQNV
jgi:curved DNA-binding protein CbpA